MVVAKTLSQYLRNKTTRLPSRQTVENAVAAVGLLHERDSGATYSLYFGNQSGQRLYSVSVYPERSRITGGKKIRPEVLNAFVQDNLDLLTNPLCCIGTWHNPEEDLTYLDVVALLSNKRQATALGRRYNQIGIFNLRQAVVIPTGGTGDPLLDLPPITERLSL
jgi:hypothetical protein